MRHNAAGEDIWHILHSERSDNREQLNRLSSLLKRVVREELTGRQREAYLLHVGKGVSQKEIARAWGVHPSVVCRHLQKADERLRHWTGKLTEPDP